MNGELGEYIMSIPAVYQNLFLLDNDPSEYLLILAGDHIYKMNYAEMVKYLVAMEADAVVGAIETPLAEATRFGVIGVDETSGILRWDEKPRNPMPLPTDTSLPFVSMGIYAF